MVRFGVRRLAAAFQGRSKLPHSRIEPQNPATPVAEARATRTGRASRKRSK